MHGKFLYKRQPKGETQRSADSVKSDFLQLSETEALIQDATLEIVRLLGGKEGDPHVPHSYRRYPYNNPHEINNLGGKGSSVVTRLYFSESVSQIEPVEPGVDIRYDYTLRFPAGGYGPMAEDPQNRTIHAMSARMVDLRDAIWKEMCKSKKFKRVTEKRGGKSKKFNHLSIHVYRAGARINSHTDLQTARRRAAAAQHRAKMHGGIRAQGSVVCPDELYMEQLNRNQQENELERERQGDLNSMMENTAVATFTVGSSRQLQFYLSGFDKQGNQVKEADPCAEAELCEGSCFILVHDDEKSKQRRKKDGKYLYDAVFEHGVAPVRGGADAFSVAFIFRCLDRTSKVDVTNDKVICPQPRTPEEMRRFEKFAKQREMDDKPNSRFKKTVSGALKELRAGVKRKGWMRDE